MWGALATGLLDEWAMRFFEELDYVKEGENATKFAASIKAGRPYTTSSPHRFVAPFCPGYPT